MAAKESQLGALHEKVATVMVRILDQVEKAQDNFEQIMEAVDTADEDLQEKLKDLVMPEVSPAMLSAMTKFLSDNKITCLPEESKAMSDLEKELATKRTRRRPVGNILPFEKEA